MSGFSCPVCGKGLKEEGGSLVCENRHCFDLAKSGYANLLLSQQRKNKRHGDDKLMVRARREFLNGGYYRPLLEGVSGVVRKYAGNGCTILDAGCGECWFTENICRDLTEHGVRYEMLAVDISKDALAAGGGRSRDIRLAVASVFHLPLQAASCDLLISLFAPCCWPEFSRVLKPGGIMIRAFPLERHLWRLKEAVYDRPYENEPETSDPEGFELLDHQEIRGSVRIVGGENIQNAFAMTPYYYKTSAGDQEKLKALSELETEIEFGILTYRRR